MRIGELAERKQILPCLDNPHTIHVTDAIPELIAAMAHASLHP
jgi:hypothetical protein